MPNIHGIHHVTAVTADAKKNLSFYTEVLGLRLVKKTVNQDDVSAYHLFYADAEGNPGTDMTFFDWEQAAERRDVTDEISRTYFRVNGKAAIAFWAQRLTEQNIAHSGVIKIDGHDGITFEDFEGQRLGLIDNRDVPFHGTVWNMVIPKEHAIRGFYALELTVPDSEPIETMLVDILGMQPAGSFLQNNDTILKFTMVDGGPHKEIFVRVVAAQPMYGSSAGSVHHAAFRVHDETELLQWVYELEQMGVPNSGVVERYYFKSVYFRISPGILFELATDGPGFAADEDMAHLGEKLALPPFLESRRKEIESGLKPL